MDPDRHDVVQRGTRLYNRAEHSYTFSGPVTATTISILLPFEEVPEAFRWYVTVRSARKFQDKTVGADGLHFFHAEDEAQARASRLETTWRTGAIPWQKGRPGRFSPAGGWATYWTGGAEMPLISTTIPNPIGGVSQQSYTSRLLSQCEAMENCLPSVVEFLRRRPATRHVARIMGTGNTDAAAVHVIDRDSAEQYIVVAAENDMKIFDLSGGEKTVNFTAGKNYLKTSSPNADMGFMIINDYTFVLNKTVSQLPPSLRLLKLEKGGK